MSDNFYPSVDINFINDQVSNSGKLAKDGIVKIGSTTTYVIEGTQAIFKRTISARELETGSICLEQATAIALRFGFLGQLLEWLENNRNWKDGGYIKK